MNPTPGEYGAYGPGHAHGASYPAGTQPFSGGANPYGSSSPPVGVPQYAPGETPPTGKGAWLVSLLAFIPFFGMIAWPVAAIVTKGKLARYGGVPAVHGRGAANFALTYLVSIVGPLLIAFLTMLITSAVLGGAGGRIQFEDAPVSFIVSIGMLIFGMISTIILGITYWVNLFKGISAADRGEPFEGYLAYPFFKR